jgi:hypothetical protein
VRKRKVITRSGARVRGLFASLKSERLIPWESPLEKDALLVLEFDSAVRRMREFQECLRIGGNDGGFDAYPDFLVEPHDGAPFLLEVKSDFDAADERVRQRLDRVAAHLADASQRYVVMCEREIRLQPRLATLELLVTFRRPGAAAALRSQRDIADLLTEEPITSFASAQRRLRCRSRVLQLIANDLLSTDLTREISDDADLSVVLEQSHADVSH